MTDLSLKELAAESLVQKHRRLMQAKCEHREVFTTTVVSERGAVTNKVCLDCGKHWRNKLDK